MKAVAALLSISFITSIHAQQEWVTILVHGSVGLGTSLSGRTLNLIKKDCIEGSVYERNVKKMRQNPYVHALQPLGELGLHPVPDHDKELNGSAVFSELYKTMAAHFGCTEKNVFYTYGWSGLISEKERQREACLFYKELRAFIQEKKSVDKNLKIRLIGYSHGGTLFSNFAKLRATEFCQDTFYIDETILVGVPLSTKITGLFACPPFARVYNIYSVTDKIQRIDVFTSSQVLTERTFKGKELFPDLTQIEFCYTAPLRRLPGKVLPSGMRGVVTQSPGHVEWWSFGWTRSMYRKNLDMYPLSGAIFIPYLLYASKKLPKQHIQVDLRPEEEQAYVQSISCDEPSTVCLPFMTQQAYTAFLENAFLHHPYSTSKCEAFLKLESSLQLQPFQYIS